MSNEKDINLGPLWSSIAWILATIIAFCFFEAMCREFMFFDEFIVSAMLFSIALQLRRFRIPHEEKE